MRRNKDQTTITDLHESIIIEILIYLPLQFIIRCSCVCKQWANIISQPYFIQPYYTNQSNKRSALPMQFLLQYQRISKKLFLAELDDASCTTASAPPDSIIPKKIPLYLKFLNDFYPDPSRVSLRICTTCSFTGFIVADAYDHYKNVRPGKYHVFNPITSQHFLVNQTNKDECVAHQCALVFVQKTNQLKLLSFFVSRYDYLSVDIQTIGTKLWRSIRGSIPFQPEETRFPTFANGFYHWIGHWKQIISSFDAEKEVFQRIPTPAAITEFSCSNLGLLDGFLCICMKSYSSSAIEFWVMNEYGIKESWTKKFVLHCNYNFKFDRILGNMKHLRHQILEPLRCLENGEIVVICRHLHAICYNPSTRSCKCIKFDGDACTRYKPFPYVPSLRRVLDIDTECQRLNRRKTRYLQL